jgi:hypothetical protein
MRMKRKSIHESFEVVAKGVGDTEIPDDVAKAIIDGAIEGCQSPEQKSAKRANETDLQWAWRTHGGARLKVRN